MKTTSTKYWYFQIIGWFGYSLAGMIISMMFDQHSLSNASMQLLAGVFMLLATHLLRAIVKHKKWLNTSIWKVAIRVLGINTLLALVVNGIVTLYGIWVVGVIPLEKYTLGLFFIYLFQTLLFLMLWTTIYFSVSYFRNYKNQEIEKWKLEAAVKDAELIALKAQINPHFLFNALNNIRGLILEDKMKARTMVDNLAEMLRYSIQFNNNETVTLGEELGVVAKYLQLESIHYEQRLNHSIQFDKKLSTAKLPPMIIQLMAENAIKHGISQVKKGGELTIAIAKTEEQLEIIVSNTGELKENENRGIGIRNALDRIKLLFNELPDFELRQEADLVIAKLKLPYKE